VRFQVSQAVISVVAVVLLAATVTGCSAAATTGAADDLSEPCASVYVIVARATNEPAGEGHMADLVAQIKRSTRQAITDVAVDYPAVAETMSGYADSSSQGAAAVRRMLIDEVARCPTQKIAMLGYSQGAQIIGDAIAGGGGGKLGPETRPVPSAASHHVSAVVQMGDPRHMAGQPFDVGTSTNDGRFPRAADQQLTSFASKVRSYCDTGDPFCDSGRDMSVHLSYLRKYSDDATQFVVDKIGGSGD
jgi:acetylxylan esterase